MKGFAGTLTRALTPQLNSAAKQASGTFSKGLVAAGGAAQKIGAGLTKYVTLPLAAGGIAATKMALDFEDAFTQIAALSGKFGMSMGQAKEAVLSLAGETGKAPTELANALYFLASAGLKASDVMPALEQSAKAAATGLGETEDIARIVSQALNAYASSGLKAADVTDTLVAAVKAGTAAPEEFSGALGRILPIAAKAGVSFQDVAASLAALSNIGLDVNEGVTAMRGLLTALEAPGTQAAETLKKVGLSAQEMRDAISQRGILGALQLLETATGGNIDTMRKIIPNVRSLTGEFGLMGENASTVEGIFKQVANSSGAMDKAFAQTAKGPAFQMRQALAKLQVAAIKLGEKLIPIATKLVGWISDLADAFSKLPGGMQETIVKFGALAVVMGPVVGLFGTLLKGAGGVLGFFSKLGTKATTAASGVAAVETAAAGAGTSFAGWVRSMGGATRVLGIAGLAYATIGHDFAQGGFDVQKHAQQFQSLEAIVRKFGTTSTEGRAAIQLMAASFLGKLNPSMRDGANALRELNSAELRNTDLGETWRAKIAALNTQHIQTAGNLRLTNTQLIAYNRWMENAKAVTDGGASKLRGLLAQLHVYNGTLPKVVQNEIQHALAIGDNAAAFRILNAQVEKAKKNAPSAAAASAAASAKIASGNDNVSNSAKNAAAQVTNLHNKAKQKVVPPPINFKTNAAAVVGQIRGVSAAAQQAAGQYTIHFNITKGGFLPVVPRRAQAAGGVFRAARGLTFMSPGGSPFIAGEAMYPTPLGTGAEVVTNRGIEPLSANHLSRIADFLAAKLERGHAPPQAGPPREIILRAKGRDLVGVIALNETWMR